MNNQNHAGVKSANLSNTLISATANTHANQSIISVVSNSPSNSHLTLEWLIPESLSIDHECTESETINYNDNLEVRVTGSSYDFVIARRFLISVGRLSVEIGCEPSWSWDEHCELDVGESALLADLEGMALLIPPTELKQALWSKFRKKQTA